MTALEIVDAIGIFVFALSGGLAASRQRMDIFGTGVVALLPAIGGGTLRDLLLGRPVFWLDAEITVLIALLAVPVTVILGERIARFKTLVWLDAAGLALFAAIGAEAAWSLGHGLIVTVMMGTITASFGGLLRDIVCNEVPLILREDIYATAALAGSALYWTTAELGAPQPWPFVAAVFLAFTVRAAVVAIREIRPKVELRKK